MTRGDQVRALNALYAELPILHCRGLCSESCGPIEMSRLERERIETRRKRKLGWDRCGNCDALALGRCSVYDIRPLICRLWGVVESMPCPHGCRPEGGLLSDDRGHELVARSLKIGGRPQGSVLAQIMAGDPV